eukprot:m.139698 g.139698  ORF g.139698 m.139698 type:complete len:67 (-) comp24080_c0_seq2:495-695(-)
MVWQASDIANGHIEIGNEQQEKVSQPHPQQSKQQQPQPHLRHQQPQQSQQSQQQYPTHTTLSLTPH